MEMVGSWQDLQGYIARTMVVGDSEGVQQAKEMSDSEGEDCAFIVSRMAIACLVWVAGNVVIDAVGIGYDYKVGGQGRRDSQETTARAARVAILNVSSTISSETSGYGTGSLHEVHGLVSVALSAPSLHTTTIVISIFTIAICTSTKVIYIFTIASSIDQHNILHHLHHHLLSTISITITNPLHPSSHSISVIISYLPFVSSPSSPFSPFVETAMCELP
ncbi:hypothetical protein CRG98_039731 [Punica granatum]|uniref:Uncharacterized protein n=1 Tax=Punica granatum TaxID=22663 RepID=A0A2I0I7E7_PUNGR|nr:hypothetical protein CRG98_039731 [Punica granatum]